MGTAPFCASAYALVHVAPPFLHFVIGFHEQSESRMVELDERPARLLAETVLQIVRDRMRHEERPAKFQQSRLLDGLNGGPIVAIAVAEIAIPPAAGPRLQH